MVGNLPVAMRFSEATSQRVQQFVFVSAWERSHLDHIGFVEDAWSIVQMDAAW